LLRLTRFAALLLATNRKAIAGTKREFATNAVLAAGLSGFNADKQENGLPWNITIPNDDKGGNSATTTAVQHTVM